MMCMARIEPIEISRICGWILNRLPNVGCWRPQTTTPDSEIELIWGGRLHNSFRIYIRPPHVTESRSRWQKKLGLIWLNLKSGLFFWSCHGVTESRSHRSKDDDSVTPWLGDCWKRGLIWWNQKSVTNFQFSRTNKSDLVRKREGDYI